MFNNYITLPTNTRKSGLSQMNQKRQQYLLILFGNIFQSPETSDWLYSITVMLNTRHTFVVPDHTASLITIRTQMSSQLVPKHVGVSSVHRRERWQLDSSEIDIGPSIKEHDTVKI